MPAIGGEHWVIDVVMGKGDQDSRIRLYAQKTAGPTETQALMNTFANTLFTTLSASLLPVLAANAQFRQIQMFLRGGNNEMEAYSSNGAQDGAGAAEMMPEENAVVIQRRTGLSGREKRGRVFMPYVPEELADDSTLTTSGANLYKALATALKTPFVSGGITLSPRTPSFKNGVLYPVVECRVLSEICSRRQRRAPKRPLPLAP